MTEQPGEATAIKPRGSLARRLVWLAAIWSVIALALTGAVLTTAFREFGIRRLEGVLESTDIEVVANTRVENGQVLTPPVQDARTLRAFSGKYWSVVEPDGQGGFRPLTRSESLFDSVLAAPETGTAMILAAPGEPYFYDAVGPDNQPLRVLAVARTLPNREAPLIFLSALDRTIIEQDTTNFAILTWTSLALLCAGLIGAVFVQVRFGLRPLHDLEEELVAVRRGKVQRLSGQYPREIAPLADELNVLLDHNQEVVERQRTHVGNLAHALKTPLAVMVTEAGVDEGLLADTVRRQTTLMQAQVDHHLQRARAAARAQSAGQSTPIEPVLDELASLLERVFQSRDVEIDWRAPETLAFRGERQDLQEILGNLLENACKWCRRRVRVNAVAGAVGRLTIRVEDDGPGLPADQRETMLQRGARLDEVTPGTGLGLSIVDELVKAYGGRITLGEAALGGLSVELDLPMADN